MIPKWRGLFICPLIFLQGQKLQHAIVFVFARGESDSMQSLNGPCIISRAPSSMQWDTAKGQQAGYVELKVRVYYYFSHNQRESSQYAIGFAVIRHEG